MQIQSALATIGLAATASAVFIPSTPSSGVSLPGYNGTGIYTITKVWDHVTTYCPEPTTLYYNNRTYTIDKPTTFIIPNCPCTQTYTTQYKDGHKPTSLVSPNPPQQTGGGSDISGGAKYGTYQLYKPDQPAQPAQSGAPVVVPGTNGTTPGQQPGVKPTVVVTAGARKRAAGAFAVVAGVVAALAL